MKNGMKIKKKFLIARILVKKHCKQGKNRQKFVKTKQNINKKLQNNVKELVKNWKKQIKIDKIVQNY